MGQQPISYPNQYDVEIHKKECDKNNLYTTNNLKALQNAMCSLSGGALKLWLYLSKNQNHYHSQLSKTAASEWGIAKSSYYRARDELKEKGFLVESGDNHFIFYDYPPNQNEESQNGTPKMAIPKMGLNQNEESQNGNEESQNGNEESQNGNEESQNGYRNSTNITNNNTINNTVETSASPKFLENSASPSFLTEQPRTELTQKELKVIPKDKYEWLNENTIKAKRTGYIFTITE